MSPLDAAKAMSESDMPSDSRDYRFCPCCADYYEGDEYPDGRHARHVVRDHAPDCPFPMLPQIVAALEIAGECAGLLQMVLDNQIRNGWVKEGSSELDIPRAVLKRWHEIPG